MKITITSILFLLLCSGINGQSDDVELVNNIIASLIGEQDVEDIPVFTSIDHVCKSGYLSCNDHNEVIGMNFQFSNLNGTIPPEITQLKKLQWVNFQYNYLAGELPEGLSTLEELQNVRLRGNFITRPMPKDLVDLKSEAEFDLSENAVDIDDKELIYLLNIIDQVNLEGCRSPDSIFISEKVNTRNPKDEEIEVLLEDIETEKLEKEDEQEDSGDKIKVVETMPRFPGCEDMAGGDKEKKSCAEGKMLQFIYKTLKYPAFARENGVEGSVFVQFVILENGHIGSAKVVRDPGAKLGNAGLWVVNRMNYLCKPWTPGTQDGEPVKVLYTLPIKFKLQ